MEGLAAVSSETGHEDKEGQGTEAEEGSLFLKSLRVWLQWNKWYEKA